MTTRPSVLRKTPVTALLVVAAGLVSSCHLGKKHELEDRPLPEPLPVADTAKRAPKSATASPRGVTSATRPMATEPRGVPRPPVTPSASASQPHAPPLDAATDAASTTTTPVEAATPPTAPSADASPLPPKMTQCLDQCRAVLTGCLTRLTRPDAGTPSAETMAHCTQAESDCRAACL
jgi:hypothetical protein